MAKRRGTTIRFGVQSSGERSEYWSVRSPKKRAEAVLAPERRGGTLHITLHEDPRHWHTVTSVAPWRVEEAWGPRFPVLPGLVHAARIAIKPTALWLPPLARDDVYWADPAPRGAVTVFELFHERLPTGPRGEPWPGRNARATRLVGRLPLSNNLRITIVVHEVSAVGMPDLAEDARRHVESVGGRAHMISNGRRADGCQVFYDDYIRLGEGEDLDQGA